MTGWRYRLLRSPKLYARFGLRDPLKRRGRRTKRPSRHPGARLGKYIGQVGERLGLTVETREPPRRIERDDVRYVYRLQDNETGGVVIWFAPEPLLKVGQAYRLRATVRRQGVFAGVRETLVSRVRIVQEHATLKRTGEAFDALCRENEIPVKEDYGTDAEYQQARKGLINLGTSTCMKGGETK